MQKKSPLNKLGKVLHAYIKDESPHSITEVGKNALGITYANFHNRLSDNNLRMYELEKVLDYLGLEATITIGNMVFQNSEEDKEPNPLVDYDDRMEKEDRILSLEEQQLQLRRQTLNLQKAIEEIKREMREGGES